MNRFVIRSTGLASLLTLVACGSSTNTVEPPTTSTVDVSTTLAVSGGVEAAGAATADAGGGRPEGSTPMRYGAPIEPGRAYHSGTEFGIDGLEVRVTGASVATHPDVVPSIVSITADPGGSDNLVTVFVPQQTGWFADATVPLAEIITLEDVVANDVDRSEPIEFFEWFADRPFVEAEPVEVGEFLGLPARTMSYRILDDAAGQSCAPNLPTCFPVLSSGGTAIVYLAGQTGTMYEIDPTDGFPVVVDVADDPVAAEIVDTLELAVDQPPESIADATAITFDTETLEPATGYRWRSAGGDWFSVTTGSEPVDRFSFGWIGIETGIGGIPPTQWFGDAPLPSPVVTLDFIELMNTISSGPSSSLPDDPIAALAALPYLDVTDGPTSVQLGDVSASYVDVRLTSTGAGYASPSGDGSVVAFPLGPELPIGSGTPTRVIFVPGTSADIAPTIVHGSADAATLALLDSLRVVADS